MDWIGEEFDPEAFNLDGVNQLLRRRAKQDWPERTSFPIDEEQTGQKSLFDPSRWVNRLSEAGEQTAQALPLRLDVVSFLVYLKENKVTGTQSTGNLPRKVVEAIAAHFVNPPELETKIGDAVFRFQNEAEVWPIYFLHVLAHAASLVSGGPNHRWVLTPIGEQFLTLPPA